MKTLRRLTTKANGRIGAIKINAVKKNKSSNYGESREIKKQEESFMAKRYVRLKIRVCQCEVQDVITASLGVQYNTTGWAGNWNNWQNWGSGGEQQ